MSVITIARQFGSGGKTLGNMVAKKLGYEVIDEQIVEMVAQEANVSTDWVDSIAKETGSEGILKRLVSRFGPFRKGYLELSLEQKPGYIDGDLYISLLHRVIPKIARQNNVIIIGRGGQYILADRPDTFHFFMIASLDHRINFMMEQYGLDRKQAQIVVEIQNKRRINLYRYFARTDFEKPELYHMVFNMNWLSMDEAGTAICNLVSTQSPS